MTATRPDNVCTSTSPTRASPRTTRPLAECTCASPTAPTSSRPEVMVTSIDPASPISTPPLTAATRHRSVHRPTITRPEVDRTSMSAASSIETRPECPVIATRPNGPWHSIRPELEPMITSVPSGQAISMRPLAPARTTPSARISALPLSTSGWAIGRAGRSRPRCGWRSPARRCRSRPLPPPSSPRTLRPRWSSGNMTCVTWRRNRASQPMAASNRPRRKSPTEAGIRPCSLLDSPSNPPACRVRTCAQPWSACSASHARMRSSSRALADS